MRIAALALLGVLCLASCGGLARSNRGARDPSAAVQARMAADLDEMAAGWAGMSRGSARKRREAEEAYEKALASFIERWSDAQSPRHWRNGMPFQRSGSNATRYVVDFAPAWGRDGGLPREYDDLRVPHGHILRARETNALRSGVGVPLVGRIERTPGVRREMPFLPPNGGNYTLTATMQLDAVDAQGTRRCRLCLHDTLNTDTVETPVGQRQLAADFTSPKHLALDRSAFGGISFHGLLFPEKALGDCQLYRVDAYDRERIPVVFVHGLMSDPHIWLNMINAICTDPVLRKRYQPWYFLYPTAMGVPQSAERLRQSLLAARDHFDPEYNDPGFERMILVGHSMGGLLSRLQVTDSQSRLYDAYFNRPPAQLNVSDTTRERLERTLFVKPLPFVKRTIFIATPHRGSTIASLNIVRRLAALIRVPFDSLLFANELLQGNVDALSPQITKWGLYSFVSVGNLSEQHPLLQGLGRTTPAVEHHSIIGVRGGGADLAHAGDGVVPYWSAHLDSAGSEKTVPHNHFCADESDVVAEVVRILHGHLRSK